MVARYGRYLSALVLVGMACSSCAGPVFGIVQPPRTVSIARIPQTAISKSPKLAGLHLGNRIYPPDSAGYIYRNFRGSNGADVPYRLGNAHFGLIMVLSRYGTATSVVAATVEHGRVDRRSHDPNGYAYVAWFYNPVLPPGDPYRDVTVKVVVSLTPMQDGLPQGVITAVALHYRDTVPGWIAGPNPDICVFGGAGSAP